MLHVSALQSQLRMRISYPKTVVCAVETQKRRGTGDMRTVRYELDQRVHELLSMMAGAHGKV